MLKGRKGRNQKPLQRLLQSLHQQTRLRGQKGRRWKHLRRLLQLLQRRPLCQGNLQGNRFSLCPRPRLSLQRQTPQSRPSLVGRRA